MNITNQVNYTYAACVRNCINHAVIQRYVFLSPKRNLLQNGALSVAAVPTHVSSHTSTRTIGRGCLETVRRARVSASIKPSTNVWSAYVLSAFSSPAPNVTGLRPPYQRSFMRRTLPDAVLISAVRRAYHVRSVATDGILQDDAGDAQYPSCTIVPNAETLGEGKPCSGQY